MLLRPGPSSICLPSVLLWCSRLHSPTFLLFTLTGTHSDLWCQARPPHYIHLRNRKNRSIFAQLRLGILPLEIETGRWRGHDIDRRICKLCTTSKVESEYHFVFECPIYEEKRRIFFDNIDCANDFLNRPEYEQWRYIMSDENIKITVSYIGQIYEQRKSLVYTT